MRERTPWSAWLRLALQLGLNPRAFWRVSLKEWRALLGEGDSLTRASFDALSQQFPDEPA